MIDFNENPRQEVKQKLIDDENLGCAWPSLAANAATVALAVADALWQKKCFGWFSMCDGEGGIARIMRRTML